MKQLNKKIKKETTVKTKWSIPIYDLMGEIERHQSLPKEILASEINNKLLAQSVRVYLANQRQGTASTKTRGEVTGSTRKIYRQKGTGRARHGDIKAPIFVGGGVVGGPKPKDFSLKISKKQRRKALFGALSLKFKNKEIIGLSNKFLEIKPKTKNLVNFFKKTNLEEDKKLLIVPEKEANNLRLAARNIPGVKIMTVNSINCYQVLNHQKILIIDKAIESIKKHFKVYEN